MHVTTCVLYYTMFTCYTLVNQLASKPTMQHFLFLNCSSPPQQLTYYSNTTLIPYNVASYIMYIVSHFLLKILGRQRVSLLTLTSQIGIASYNIFKVSMIIQLQSKSPIASERLCNSLSSPPCSRGPCMCYSVAAVGIKPPAWTSIDHAYSHIVV